MSDTQQKTLSNLGRLFAILVASKAVDYFKLPATIMGLTQIAAEESWVTMTSYLHQLNTTNTGITMPSISWPWLADFFNNYVLPYLILPITSWSRTSLNIVICVQ